MEWQQLLRCWMYHWHHTELRAEVQSERNLVRRTRVRVFVFRCACLCLSTAEWLSTATAVTDLSSTASLIYDTHEGMHTRLSQSCSNSKSRRRSSKAQHWSLYSLHSSTLFLKKKQTLLRIFFYTFSLLFLLNLIKEFFKRSGWKWLFWWEQISFDHDWHQKCCRFLLLSLFSTLKDIPSFQSQQWSPRAWLFKRIALFWGDFKAAEIQHLD